MPHLIAIEQKPNFMTRHQGQEGSHPVCTPEIPFRSQKTTSTMGVIFINPFIQLNYLSRANSQPKDICRLCHSIRFVMEYTISSADRQFNNTVLTTSQSTIVLECKCSAGCRFRSSSSSCLIGGNDIVLIK